MRTWIFLLLLLLGGWPAGAAAPYSHLEEMQTSPQDFLSYKLVHQPQISYCIEFDESKNSNLTFNQLDTFIQAALREWTYGLALRIRRAGRAEEFADVLAILEKPLALVRAPNCQTQTDLAFVVSPTKCQAIRHRPGSFFTLREGQAPLICTDQLNGVHPLQPIPAGEYIPQANTPKGQIILQNRNAVFAQIAAGNYSAQTQQHVWETDRFFSYDTPTLFAMLAHEIGHAFGLRDEYLPDRPRQYATPRAGSGIMQANYQPIGCDETDGMITLLDRVLDHTRPFESFCSAK